MNKHDEQLAQETLLHAVPKKDPHILDFLTLFAKYRAMVLAITFGTAFAFLGFTYLMRHTYTATATILPPEKQSMSGLMSFLTGSGALDLMKGAENPATDMFKNILDSRTLAEIIADDQRIRTFFSRFDTAKGNIASMAAGSLTAEPLRNGLMLVTVDIETHWMPSSEEQDSARKISAYLSNLFVRELDRYNRERLMTSAKNTRIFVEGEYKSRMHQLDSMYALLQNFQEKNKAISLTDQLQATVMSAASLAGQVQQLSMQIAVEERELNSNSTRVELLRAQLSEAKRALSKYDAGGVGEYVIALNTVPTLARQLAHYTREVKLLETMSAFLRQQWEQEKIAEQRDLASLHVLDVAQEPMRRSSPRRGQMGILGFVIGLALSAFAVVIRRYRDDLRARPWAHSTFLNFTHALRRGKKAKLVTIDNASVAYGASAAENRRESRSVTSN